jgi:hypothetical protein
MAFAAAKLAMATCQLRLELTLDQYAGAGIRSPRDALGNVVLTINPCLIVTLTSGH